MQALGSQMTDRQANWIVYSVLILILLFTAESEKLISVSAWGVASLCLLRLIVELYFSFKDRVNFNNIKNWLTVVGLVASYVFMYYYLSAVVFTKLVKLSFLLGGLSSIFIIIIVSFARRNQNQ
jgi:hypothetical protein